MQPWRPMLIPQQTRSQMCLLTVLFIPICCQPAEWLTKPPVISFSFPGEELHLHVPACNSVVFRHSSVCEIMADVAATARVRTKLTFFHSYSFHRSVICRYTMCSDRLFILSSSKCVRLCARECKRGRFGMGRKVNHWILYYFRLWLIE